MYLYCFCMLVQGTAEKQLLLMLCPCLNNIKKNKKKKPEESTPQPSAPPPGLPQPTQQYPPQYPLASYPAQPPTYSQYGSSEWQSYRISMARCTYRTAVVLVLEWVEVYCIVCMGVYQLRRNYNTTINECSRETYI